jgi:hypothetical protein
VTSILALFFKAMRRPILHLFEGNVLPQPVASWAIRRNQRAMARPDQIVQAPGEIGTDALLNRWRSMLDLAVPMRPEHMKPTRFGNMMANLEDHTSAIHGMDYFLWWPRLAPLLPDAMQDIVTSEFANMTGLLNLSLVWATIGVAGAAVLGLIGSLWGTALAVLVVGLLLSSVSYRAAIRQGSEAGRYRHAAFDLYRHEILKQMELEIPGDREAERALWKRLSTELLGRSAPVASDSAAPGALTKTAKTGATRHQSSASRTTGAARSAHN